MIDLSSASFVPSEDGRWIDANFERLARVVEDYDPQFELRWIPPEHRATLEERAKPYVVWDTVANCAVFFASETDTPSQILGRLFEGDNKFGDVLTRLDAHNNAVKALELKKQMDDSEEKKDYARFLIGTNQNFINMGKGRVVDDQLRTVRRGHD